MQLLAPYGAQREDLHCPHATQLFELRTVGLIQFVPIGDGVAYSHFSCYSTAVDTLLSPPGTLWPTATFPATQQLPIHSFHHGDDVAYCHLSSYSTAVDTLHSRTLWAHGWQNEKT